jgi:hypothetical protein
MKRRTVLQILPMAALPARAADFCAANGGSRFENYAFVFFTADDAELAGRLMEIIIPADENSPGARQARTAAFADLMLSTGSEDDRNRWREGLELFRLEAERTSLEAAVAKVMSISHRRQDASIPSINPNYNRLPHGRGSVFELTAPPGAAAHECSRWPAATKP